jgi:hypothetical protein
MKHQILIFTPAMQRELNKVREEEKKMVFIPRTKKEKQWLKGFWETVEKARNKNYPQ